MCVNSTSDGIILFPFFSQANTDMDETIFI